MDKNNLVLLFVIKLSLVCSHFVQSPCPDIFNYQADGSRVYGQIVLQGKEPVSQLEIEAMFSISGYVNDYGRIELENEMFALRNYNKGGSMQYRIHFPESSSLPRITKLTVNGKTICNGPKAIPEPNQIITNYVLKQITYITGTELGLGITHKQQPQQQQQQQTFIPNFGEEQNFQNSPYKEVDDNLYDKLYSFLNNLFVIRKVDVEDIARLFPRSLPIDVRCGRTLHAQATLLQTITYSVPADGVDLDEPVTASSRPSVSKPSLQPRPISLSRPSLEPIPPSQPKPLTTTRPLTTAISGQEERTQEVQTPNAVTTPRPVIRKQPQSNSNIECGTRFIAYDKLPLIYNGQNYSRGDLPWLVAIYRKKAGNLSFICGGTLVSNRHVVTAAHCLLDRLSLNDLVVKVGVHNLNDWDDDISVTRTLLDAAIHKSYNSSSYQNDIMVLTFSKRVDFNNYIRPACLWNGDTALERVVGASGLVAGWGSQVSVGAGAGEPQSVYVPIVTTTTCRSSSVAFHDLTSDTTFCAGDRRGSGPCTGDSGGGLYLLDGGKWRLRGVVSVSLRGQSSSCNLNEYVVFTDAAQFLPWIRQILQKEYFD